MKKLNLQYPISDEAIINLTKSTLELDKSEKNIKLVLMDAISSLPGVRFPWEKICQLCHQYNVYSLVDGAQAITQIPVNISETQPDFFVSSLHKWSYVPRGCAVLYVRRDLQPLVHSIPIGETYVNSAQQDGSWVTEHKWTGAIDWSGYLCVNTAFEFIEKCGGGKKIREYCHHLAVKGGDRVAEILGTEVLKCPAGESEYTANMVNVRLDLAVSDHDEHIPLQKTMLLDKLFEKDCFLNPFIMLKNGKKEWWCRFSAQIYLDIDDFERGAQILKEICFELQRSHCSKKQYDETESSTISIDSTTTTAATTDVATGGTTKKSHLSSLI